MELMLTIEMVLHRAEEKYKDLFFKARPLTLREEYRLRAYFNLRHFEAI
jgi:hypothetical protein